MADGRDAAPRKRPVAGRIFPLTRIGRYRYTPSWGMSTISKLGRVTSKSAWRRSRILKCRFATGAVLLEQVQARATKEDSAKLATWARKLRTGNKDDAAVAFALQDETIGHGPIDIPIPRSKPGTSANWKFS